MRFAFFDTVSGISGDMTLGACIDAGVPIDRLVEELKKLPLSGYHVEMRHVMRSSIQAVKVDVFVHEHVHEHVSGDENEYENENLGESGTSALQRAEGVTHEGSSGDGAHQRAEADPHDHHAHEHPSDHTHDHGARHHVHEHQPSSASGGLRRAGVHEHSHHHRSYREIRAMIASSQLSEKVQQTAQAIFLKLAEAEAAVHGTTVDEVHFHEVGAVDSIVDIVGAAICLDLLGVDRVYSTPVRTGSGGTVRTQHGVMPVPAPATVELLKGYPVEPTEFPHELATPTGAAIIAALSSGVLPRGAAMRVEAVGYGAGTKEFADLPNMLRLVIAETEGEESPGKPLALEYAEETLVLLETNIDDMNPELLPFVIERLFEAGARDAWLAPVLMKKGRPAHVLSVLADPSAADRMFVLITAETSTLGVRMQPLRRRSLPREARVLDTAFGPVAVKVVSRGSGEALVPEFEECARIARERNLPLIDVYRSLAAELLRREGDNRETTTPPAQA